MIVSKFLHILGFTVWIGGMFFAYMVLRPVAMSSLLPEQRLTMWAGVFAKFFGWVWVAIGLILGSGFYMMAQLGTPPLYVTAMFVLGISMMGIFAHIFFAPYKRLRRAVAAQDWKVGGVALNQIRALVGTNLLLGLVTMALGALGPLVG
jgi:uncharacterized membrane protein